MVQPHPARGDYIQKWPTLSLGIKLENKTFSTFDMRILQIKGLFSSSQHLTPRSTDVILVWIETIKSFEIYLMYTGLFSLVTKMTQELRF